MDSCALGIGFTDAMMVSGGFASTIFSMAGIGAAAASETASSDGRKSKMLLRRGAVATALGAISRVS